MILLQAAHTAAEQTIISDSSLIGLGTVGSLIVAIGAAFGAYYKIKSIQKVMEVKVDLTMAQMQKDLNSHKDDYSSGKDRIWNKLEEMDSQQDQILNTVTHIEAYLKAKQEIQGE